MLFKSELIDKIRTGQKTQTRRPASADDFTLIHADGCRAVYAPHLKWQVGKTYAIQPGRGKAAVARFELLQIRREDVRAITLEDAIAEGFQTREEFWIVWTQFYDGVAYYLLKDGHWDCLNNRPDNLYDAWALTFRLVDTP